MKYLFEAATLLTVFSMIAVFRRLSSASPSPVVLVGLFIVAFCIPFFGTLLTKSIYTYLKADPIASAEAMYGPLGDPGDYSASKAIRVASPALDPAAGSDFMVYLWFSAKELPAVDRNLIVLEKIDYRDPQQPGYAIGIRHDKDAYRPIVYWKDKGGRGRWFALSDMEVLPRTWMFLALSFRADRYLGVHGAIRISENDIRSKLLGGYDLIQTVLPHTDVPLIAGSVNDRRIKVKLGPVGLVSGKGIAENFRNVLKDATKRPNRAPSAVSTSNLLLWTFKNEDRSEQQGNKIELVSPNDIAHD